MCVFTAIGIYNKNIKAYYRQALAYKHLKDYQDAYKAACKGHDMQPSSVSIYLNLHSVDNISFILY